MAIQQDEKIENVNEIFNYKNKSLQEKVNKKIQNNNYNIKIEDFATLDLEKLSSLPKDEIANVLLKVAKDGSKQLKLMMIDFFQSNLGKNIQIEVRRDISRILMKSNDEIIRRKSIEFLNIPVKQEFDKLKSNENKNQLIAKQTDFLNNYDKKFSTAYDLTNIDKEKDFSIMGNIDNQRNEHILCLTLWMGGDGAIFNESDILQHLPYKDKDIKKSLEVLRKEKILGFAEGNYFLTKKGSILVNSILLKIIAEWYNASLWVEQQGYSTIHHGFINDKRNTALSNLNLSLRSFVTDYFQFVLENFVEFYSYKKISFFSNFRKILILISLCPYLNYIKQKSKELGDVFSDFSENELIKIIDYNNEKLVIIKDDLLTRRNRKGRNQ